MNRWVLLWLSAVSFWASGLLCGMQIWKPKPFDFTSQTLKFTSTPASIPCSEISFYYYADSTYRPRLGMSVSCDGQLKIIGPRDEAAQAFWDRVIELTPRNYAAPNHILRELKR